MQLTDAVVSPEPNVEGIMFGVELVFLVGLVVVTSLGFLYWVFRQFQKAMSS